MADPGSDSSDATLAAIAMAVLVGIIGTMVFLVMKMSSAEEQPRESKPEKGGQRRRGALDRMQQGAARTAADADEDDEEEDGSEGDEDAAGDQPTKRNAAKKDQKKQEKKAQQQAERQIRQERESAMSEKNSKYKEKQKEKETQQQRKEEEEKRSREDKERREKEEFESWKEMFSVDMEGEEEASKEPNAVEKFVEYIKRRKVVNLEDVAADFRMRTTSAIERIRELEKLGRLSGIFDDRGKYVYISAEEFAEVAAWLKKTGRISRADLVAACNRIVRVNPTEEDKALLAQEAQSAAANLEDEESGGATA